MTEDELNLEYLKKRFKELNINIKDLTLLKELLRVCNEFYIEGLSQARFDKRMLEFELEKKKQEKELYKSVIDEVSEYLSYFDSNQICECVTEIALNFEKILSKVDKED